MSERRLVCGACGLENPGDAHQCGACGSRMLRPAPRIRPPGFRTTLLIVVMLWVGTPIVIGIVESIRLEPGATYGPDFSVYVGTAQTYALYGLVGAIAGFVVLSKHRPIGTGILAGTGIGLLLGFITCLSVAGAVT